MTLKFHRILTPDFCTLLAWWLEDSDGLVCRVRAGRSCALM